MRLVISGVSLLCFLFFSCGTTEPVEQKTSYPNFSWDKVPVYIHYGDNGGMSDEEIEFVATRSNLVCLEKGHGMQVHGSTEAGLFHDARKLKEINPNLKFIYYWNTFLDYGMYDAHKVYNSHPEWWLRTLDGSLDFKRGDLKRYDLSNPEVREWWSDEVKKAVAEGPCDGVFMDAFPQIASPGNIPLWGQEKFDSIQDGLKELIRLTREKAGPEALIMYNGIRHRPDFEFGREYFDLTDIATIEHFGHFASGDPDCIAKDLKAMMDAGDLGKIVIMKGWPGFNWTQRETREIPYDELLQRARENITFPLACFLVAAREHSYFCYTWGYREQHGSLDWYDEFDRPLGPPKGDAVIDGWNYSREFEHCSVWVNIESRDATIEWK